MGVRAMVEQYQGRGEEGRGRAGGGKGQYGYVIEYILPAWYKACLSNVYEYEWAVYEGMPMHK